ncbi:MAG: hypothetical protein ACD_19C00007G0001 [uncultured bacterium]|nr:MAG: hypothetical protein ACD_19C00007G0001 [uncultured bacterium]
MEKEKRENRRFVAIVFGVIAGFSVMVFWLIYLGFGGGFMPSITKIPLVGDFIYELPFGISRWWDIPMAGLIVYVLLLLSAKEKDANLFYVIALLGVFILMTIFGNKIFIPLLSVELTFGFSIGIRILRKKDYPLIRTKEILEILPKELLIATWAGLSLSVGTFYGFVIGAVLALISTLSIAFFGLIVFFWKKDWKKLLNASFAVCFIFSLVGLFISGKIIANLTATLIFGGLFLVSVLFMWILNPHNIFKKEKI